MTRALALLRKAISPTTSDAPPPSQADRVTQEEMLALFGDLLRGRRDVK